MSGLVFYMSGLVFYMSGLVLTLKNMSGLVFYMSGLTYIIPTLTYKIRVGIKIPTLICQGWYFIKSGLVFANPDIFYMSNPGIIYQP